jgi:hypothetical protein
MWWSPLIINNAVCSWLLKYHGLLTIDAPLTCQAGDVHGWRSPEFAIALHRAFLDRAEAGDLGCFAVPDFLICLSRFSINCIGFFGEDRRALDDRFCPADVDDEEWISAVLPSTVNRPGRICGDLPVAHFSFFTQETELLQSGLLNSYYRLAQVEPLKFPVKRLSAREAVRKFFLRRWLHAWESYSIGLPPKPSTSTGGWPSQTAPRGIRQIESAPVARERSPRLAEPEPPSR